MSHSPPAAELPPAQAIEEWTPPAGDPAELLQRVLQDYRPLVLRGLAADWPAVQAAAASATAICDYLQRFDRGQMVKVVVGPDTIDGRLFYNHELDGFNFQRRVGRLSAVLQRLQQVAREGERQSIVIQSAPLQDNLPGFAEQNPLSLLPSGVIPRIWIGTAHRVAAHYDPQDNLAVCVAGRRRFTLFPPEQIGNLYIGPLDLTPAGAAISLVDLDAPDLGQFPRFSSAWATAQTTVLEPGDVLYIPALWWHHVRSTQPVNVLVNYWWPGAEAGLERAATPFDSLLHALLAIRDLPPQRRAAWAALFDHYIFLRDVDPGAHLPSERRGILGTLNAEQRRKLLQRLRQALRP